MNFVDSQREARKYRQMEAKLNAADFETTVGQFYRARPFRPFSIVMEDGQVFEIETRSAIIFRGGVASCQTDDVDIFFIHSEHVKEVRPMSAEAVS